jgi:hypothetical protein
MPFAWRREDSGYLAAAVAAAAVVVYIVIGNFGLLPFPFAAPNAAPAIVDAIEPVVGAAPGLDIEIPRVAAPRPAPGPSVIRGPLASDGASPAVSVSTAPGTSFGVAAPAVIEGLVEDVGSGVDTVLVTFTSTTGTESVVPAKVTCDDQARTNCTWRAEVPSAVAAGYSVTAEALDRAGNKASSDAVDVTVVNPAGTVEQVTDVVGRVPAVLDKLVGSIVGILGGGG